MNLISVFHMDMNWIWIYGSVEDGLWIGYGSDFNPSGPTGCSNNLLSIIITNKYCMNW